MEHTFSQEVCDLKHKSIDDRFDKYDKYCGTVDTLVKSDAVHTADIAHLADSLKTFKVAAWGLFGSGVLMLLGWVFQLLK